MYECMHVCIRTLRAREQGKLGGGLELCIALGLGPGRGGEGFAGEISALRDTDLRIMHV